MARPKRQFTEEDEQQMYKYALAGCQNGTIAKLMCISKTTLIRRYGTLLQEKRAERKYNIRNNQTNLCENNPAMAIFLGKNELGQTDKQTIETKQVDIKARTEQQREADRAAAKAYNEAMSRSQPKPGIIPLKRKEGA